MFLFSNCKLSKHILSFPLHQGKRAHEENKTNSLENARHTTTPCDTRLKRLTSDESAKENENFHDFSGRVVKLN
jgi:hypothetical protein